MPIYNQIFEHYRQEQRKIEKAIKLLKNKGFYIKDLKEDKYLTKKQRTHNEDDITLAALYESWYIAFFLPCRFLNTSIHPLSLKLSNLFLSQLSSSLNSSKSSLLKYFSDLRNISISKSAVVKSYFDLM